jgi:hypothetical protein
MPFFDLLKLALRNLREARLRATLTSMGVIVGVAVIVTMVSFGLGLQRNLLSRFKALDLFSEMTVFGKSLAVAAGNLDRQSARRAGNDRQGPRLPQILRLREFWMMQRLRISQRFPASLMSNRSSVLSYSAGRTARYLVIKSGGRAFPTALHGSRTLPRGR